VTLPEGGAVTYSLQRLRYPFDASQPEIPPGVVVVTTRSLEGIGITPATWTFQYVQTNLTHVIWRNEEGTPVRTDVYQHTTDDGSSIYAGRTWLGRVDLGGLESTEYVWRAANDVAPIGLDYQSCETPQSADCQMVRARPPLIAAVNVSRSDNAGVVFGTTYDYRGTDYNDYGHPATIMETGSFGRTTTLTYRHDFPGYVRGKVATVTMSGLGTIAVYAYASTGFLQQQTIHGVSTTYTADAYGRVRTESDGTHPATTYGYEAGSQKDVFTPEYTVYRGINADGTVRWESRAEFAATSFQYDAVGRRVWTAPPAWEGRTEWNYLDGPSGARIETQRCEFNHDSWSGDPRCSVVTTSWLDGLGRVRTTVSNGSARVDVQYDAAGRTGTETLPYVNGMSSQASVTYAYDALGRVTTRKETTVDGVTTDSGWEYATLTSDPACPSDTPCLRVRLTQSRIKTAPGVQEPSEAVTTQYWQATGSPDKRRLVATQDAEGAWTRYAYDTLDALVAACGPGTEQQVTPCPAPSVAGAPVRLWSYNSLHQLQLETHPESGTVAHTYSADGLLRTTTDANGVVHTFSYDNNRRLRSDVTTQGGATLGTKTFAYNAYDKPTEAVNGTVRTTFTYRNNGVWPDTKTLAVNGRLYSVVNEVYDHLGNPTKIINPSGWCPRYTYNYAQGGVPTSLQARDPADQMMTFASGAQYHPSGALARYVAGNGVEHVVALDARGRVRTVSAGSLQLVYDYDDLGNVRKTTDVRPGQTREQWFGYDLVDRLVASVGFYGSSAFDYDAMGNRGAVSGQAVYDTGPGGTFRLSSTVGSGAYTYYANGSLSTAGGHTYGYTPDGLIRSVDGSAAEYTYDAEGHRVMRRVNGTTTYYVYGWHGELVSEFEEISGAESWKGDYLYLAGRLVARVSGQDQRSPLPFTNVEGAALGAWIPSNPVRLGTGTSGTVTVTAGQYRLCGDAACAANPPFVTSPGAAQSGQYLQLAATAPTTANTVVQITVYVGATHATWSVRTTFEGIQPDPFSFADLTNIPASTVVASNIVQITGITGLSGGAAVSISSPGQYRICLEASCVVGAPPFRTGVGAVHQGEYLQLQLVSSATPGGVVRTTVTVDGVSATWTVAGVQDLTPDPFTLPDVSGVPSLSLVSSSIVRILGIAGTIPTSITGGAYRVCGDASCSTAPAFTTGPSTILNGQYLQLRVTSGAYTTVSATITVGTGSDTWSVASATLIANADVALTASPAVPAAPVAPGWLMTWTASVTGGHGVPPYEYRFWICDGSTGLWTVIREYSTTPSAFWASPVVGTFIAAVQVRSAGSTAAVEGTGSSALFAVTTPPGRYKWNGSGTCYWEPNDFGLNQCYPPAQGRWKWDGNGNCYWDQNDSGPNQCTPHEPAAVVAEGPQPPDDTKSARRNTAAALALVACLLACTRRWARRGGGVTRERWRARLAITRGAAVLLLLLAGSVPLAAQTVEYYHLDALGSVRVTTNAAGQEIARHDYLPFGEEWAQTVPTTDVRHFTGKERDGETGLDYFGARYYRADIGRFTTVDPVYTWQENLTDPQRWNRYAYARNNPLKFVDPDGKDVMCATAACYQAHVRAGATGAEMMSGAAKGAINAVIGAANLMNTLVDSALAFTPYRIGQIDYLPMTPTEQRGAVLADAVLAAVTVGESLVTPAFAARDLASVGSRAGNFGIGTATADRAAELGRAWVGDGARVASDGKTLVSADGLRQFRPPSYKPSLGTVQANFEWRKVAKGRWEGNGHLDILERGK
jgi:RHS repeat-associated protein